jgi:hypothetical protein
MADVKAINPKIELPSLTAKPLDTFYFKGRLLPD